MHICQAPYMAAGCSRSSTARPFIDDLGDSRDTDDINAMRSQRYRMLPWRMYSMSSKHCSSWQAAVSLRGLRLHDPEMAPTVNVSYTRTEAIVFCLSCFVFLPWVPRRCIWLASTEHRKKAISPNDLVANFNTTTSAPPASPRSWPPHCRPATSPALPPALLPALRFLRLGSGWRLQCICTTPYHRISRLQPVPPSTRAAEHQCPSKYITVKLRWDCACSPPPVWFLRRSPANRQLDSTCSCHACSSTSCSQAAALQRGLEGK